ncbi:uncharacterized protein LOC134062677 [Sardina pilchardus]|uniref:uncharacterized protein LOC134062677 n=1 Tax=Sardina pilchardus TaxID=27697 RepID=UPI002E151510
MVMEQKVQLTVNQNELLNTQILLHKMEDELNRTEEENDVQHTEMAVLKTRLAASETEVVNLRKETAELKSVTERLAVTETDMEHVKKDTAAQHTDLTTIKTEVINLIKENAAQEIAMVNLKMDNAAQQTEMVNLKTDNAAQQTEMTRLASTETEVVNLKKEITDQPKVAFSVGLTDSGLIEAGNTERNLVFTKIFTNVGQAYSSVTGFFTAPVKGVYYFRFNVMDNSPSGFMNIMMYKNGERLMFLGEDPRGYQTYLSSGLTLQLEVGDVVNLRLKSYNSLYDNANNHNIFSGFLLFPL